MWSNRNCTQLITNSCRPRSDESIHPTHLDTQQFRQEFVAHWHNTQCITTDRMTVRNHQMHVNSEKVPGDSDWKYHFVTPSSRGTWRSCRIPLPLIHVANGLSRMQPVHLVFQWAHRVTVVPDRGHYLGVRRTTTYVSSLLDLQELGLTSKHSTEVQILRRVSNHPFPRGWKHSVLRTVDKLSWLISSESFSSTTYSNKQFQKRRCSA